MTDKEAMKQIIAEIDALPEGLEGYFSDAFADNLAKVRKALAQPEQEPVVHDPLPRACNLAGVDYQTFLKIKAYMPVAPPQPEQIQPSAYSNTHQPEQEPVAKNDGGKITWLIDDWPQNCLLYTYPPKSFSYEQVKAHIRAASMSANDIVVGSDVTNDGVSIVIRKRDEILYAEFFAHPPQREWQGLTDDEREEATGWSVEHIEAKLREKNT